MNIAIVINELLHPNNDQEGHEARDDAGEDSLFSNLHPHL